MQPNTLYYGDNLRVLREHIPDASVDLIYLDPPAFKMRTEAASAGYFHSELWRRDFPRLQIATVEELLANRLAQLPVGIIGSQTAPRVRRSGDPRQATFDMAPELEGG